MRTESIVILGLFLLTGQLFGADKGKEQVFQHSKEDVWNACVKAASQQFTLDYSDKESGVLSFSSGISLTSNGFKGLGYGEGACREQDQSHTE
jgi:hypothetical protein